MKEFFKNLKLVWKYCKGEKKRIVLYFFLGTFRLAISIIYPLISAKVIVDITNNNVRQFILMALVIFSVDIFTNIISYFRSKLFQKIFRQTYLNIQTSLGAEILKLNNKTLEDNGSGVFIQRLVNDASSISTIFIDINVDINSVISNIGVFVTYFVISRPIFFFVFFSFIVKLTIETIKNNIHNKNNKSYKENQDRMAGFTSEIVRGAEDIKMLNGECSFLSELKTRFQNLNDEAYNMNNTDLSFSFTGWCWSDISSLVVFIMVGILVGNGSLSAAFAVVIINFGGRYNQLAYSITRFHRLIKNFNLSATRIFEIFTDEKFQKETFGTKHLNKVEGYFEFKNVTFRYDKADVLDDLSFKVNANETVAFVGKSGAGKTTIFNLLCKMYDNYEGTITIDDVDIKELDKDTIRGNITIVSQNPYIFNMSIRDNLRLVKKDLTEKEMKKACKMACLDEYIESLPEKYDTVVGEGGVNLSGGQKQRLAIARAFVQKTEIILFDEATSALDNETQSKIQKAIDNLQKEYTILIIAHRLSTIKNADRILFVNDGKVIAQGTHEQLIKKCKEYKELYNTEISRDDD